MLSDQDKSHRASLRSLPAKRRKFVKEYLIDLNGTRAAIRSGYEPKNAHSEGARLLSDAKVRELIEKEQAFLATRTNVTQEQVVRELALLAFSNLNDFTRLEGDKRVVDFTHATREHLAPIQEIIEDSTGGSGDGERKVVVRTRVKMADKAKALELLSRHLGMLHDKTEHTGKVELIGLSDDDLAAKLRKLRGE